MLLEVTRKVRQQLAWIASLVAVVAVLAWQLLGARDDIKPDTQPHAEEPRRTEDPRRAPDGLDVPPEARETLQAIQRGGPFRYRQDGAVFQNREGHLPVQPRGYYREYTVETPGSRDRGPRRIVTGGDPPSEFFYTSDHYRSFRRIEVPQ